MDLMLISTALSVVFSLVAGSMLSVSESCYLQIILVVISLLSIRLKPNQRKPILALLALSSLGLWYSFVWVERQMDHRLPLELSGQSFALSGCIHNTPKHELNTRSATGSILRFELALKDNTVSINGLRRARLSWYDPSNSTEIRQGTCIEGVFKLRTPRNFENGLAYDYQASMLYQGIDAIGYVRSATITEHANAGWIDRLKSTLLVGQTSSTAPWVKGLVLGDKTAFTSEQWALVQQTGTLHLLVVSGLHVGLIAFSGLLLGSVLSRITRVALHTNTVSHPRYIALLKWSPLAGAITFASAYVVVAGAGLSLIRAWVMLLFIAFVWYHPKRLNAWLSVVGAMIVVLIVNPMSWTQSGFWFSFSAVAALVFFFRGRRSSRLSAFLLPQLVIIVVLLPVSILFDQLVSPIHILANTVAIPIITFCILPLTFLSLGALSDWGISELAMDALAWIATYYWQVLEQLSALPLQSLPIFSIDILIGWLVLVCLTMMGARGWVLGITAPILYLASIMLPLPTTPGLWLIDSGQGQSLVVSDEHLTVVLDTGPALSAEFSIAQMILTPILRNIHSRRIDYLVLSHSDNDHAGGAQDLQNGFEITNILVGQPIAGLSGKPSQPLHNCHFLAGTVEQTSNTLIVSDNIQLQFYPIPLDIQTDDNNSSCVVKLHWYGHTLMVPGDASIDVERYLVGHNADNLTSDILIAGHHGSKTSTARFWLNAIQPQEVWVSAGFGNRFDHPHQEVIERIASSGATLRNTAHVGKISMTPDGVVHTAREGWKPKWKSN
jgi:competence protein ComEC